MLLVSKELVLNFKMLMLTALFKRIYVSLTNELLLNMLILWGLLMQECLCILVCDDSEEVSLSAEAFFRYLHSSQGKHHIKHDFSQIFRRCLHYLFLSSC